MGTQIRRVVANWQHPKDYQTGFYKLLLDRDFEEESIEWLNELAKWQTGEYEGKIIRDTSIRAFCKHYGNFPDPAYYLSSWKEEERTHFQIYENTSKGTPLSPVFATEAEMKEWLLAEGYNEYVADQFIHLGFAPVVAQVVKDGKAVMGYGINSLELFKEE